MLDYNFIKQQFINKHEIIDNYEYLDKYITFLLNYKLNNNINENDYIEKHHILPRSCFPQFVKDEWNLVTLKYEDHKLVHLWLFKASNSHRLAY